MVMMQIDFGPERFDVREIAQHGSFQCMISDVTKPISVGYIALTEVETPKDDLQREGIDANSLGLEDRMLFLNEIKVDPKYRRRGIGAYLRERARQYADDQELDILNIVSPSFGSSQEESERHNLENGFERLKDNLFIYRHQIKPGI